jgi:hypothetical protein
MPLLALAFFVTGTIFAQEPVQEQVTVGVVELTVHAADRSGEPGGPSVCAA